MSAAATTAAVRLAPPPDQTHAAGPRQHGFNPYDYNGGTVLAVAGTEYVAVAGDTRMSSGFNILSRKQSKLIKLTDKIVLASGGFRADIVTLQKTLTAKMTQYAHQHGEEMKVHAVAQMLANTLYGRRFFPYYTWNILSGLDENGVGCVYSYDPVGNYERVRVNVTGSAEPLIQPLLDNQFERQHQQKAPTLPALSIDMGLDETVEILKDAFTSAGQRDIKTGDTMELWIITKDGVAQQTFPLNVD